MNITIRSATDQLEKETLSNEDLLTLLEGYIVESHSDYASDARKETARIYTIALTRMILSKMS